MKKTFAVVSLLLMASSLAACGSNDSNSGSAGGSGGGSANGSSGNYCDSVKAVKDEVASGSLTTLSQTEFDKFRSKLGDVEAAAPTDIADDWKTLGDYLGKLEGVLSDAGISIDDLQSIQSGKLPPGVDLAAVKGLSTKLQALASGGDTAAALKAIKASTQSECSINLEQAPSGTPSTAAPSS